MVRFFVTAVELRSASSHNDAHRDMTKPVHSGILPETRAACFLPLNSKSDTQNVAKSSRLLGALRQDLGQGLAPCNVTNMRLLACFGRLGAVQRTAHAAHQASGQSAAVLASTPRVSPRPASQLLTPCALTWRCSASARVHSRAVNDKGVPRLHAQQQQKEPLGEEAAVPPASASA